MAAVGRSVLLLKMISTEVVDNSYFLELIA